MSPHDPASDYVSRILLPHLRSFGLATPQQLIVVDDVHRRLHSLLARWQDLPFRRTILTLGLEEATFYEPRDASLDVLGTQ